MCVAEPPDISYNGPVILILTFPKGTKMPFRNQILKSEVVDFVRSAVFNHDE